MYMLAVRVKLVLELDWTLRLTYCPLVQLEDLTLPVQTYRSF